MSKTAVQVLCEIENGPDAFMIIGQEKGKILTDLIDKHKPKSVLEVGTNLGYSSILIAAHLPEDGKVTTLELGEIISRRAIENIKKAGFEDKITVIIGNALDTIKKLTEKFDFVFIDATKKEYLEYFKLIENKFSPKAIIVADNVKIFAEEVCDYLKYVKEKYNSETVVVGDDALEITKI